MGLHTLGLTSGGRVGVLSENRIEWVLSQMGAGVIGAVTVGLYPTSPAPETAYVLGHADVELLVCEDQEQVEKVLEQRHELPCLRSIVLIETQGLGSYTGAHSAFICTIESRELA